MFSPCFFFAKGFESLPQTQIFYSLYTLQPDCENLWYFKLILFDLTEYKVWNFWGLRHWVVKIKGLENLSLWQRLKSFSHFFAKQMKTKFSEICFRIFRERTECEKYETFVKGNYLRKNAKISQKPWVLHKWYHHFWCLKNIVFLFENVKTTGIWEILLRF